MRPTSCQHRCWVVSWHTPWLEAPEASDVLLLRSTYGFLIATRVGQARRAVHLESTRIAEG